MRKVVMLKKAFIPNKVNNNISKEHVTLKIPIKTLGKLTAEVLKTKRISNCAATTVLSQGVNLRGGNLDDVATSCSTIQTKEKCVI